MNSSLLRASLFATLLASPFAAGCSHADLTELVIVVRADVPVDDLYLTVASPEGAVAVDQHVHAPTLPLTLVLTRDHAPYGPVNVHVEGAAIAVDAITELVPGERRRLDMVLSASCRCTTCSATETCRGGGCEDRHVAAASLPPWTSGGDTGVAPGRDASVMIDAGPRADGGTCGCQGQPCCGSTCASTFSCRADVCMDCQSTTPTVTGMTATVMHVPAISATGDTLWISVSDGTSVNQVGFALAGGLRATGTAPALMQLVGVSGSGSTLNFRGMGTAMGHLGIEGATVTGSFMAAAHADGTDGEITRIVGSGNTLTLTAWNNAMGTITFDPIETCR